MKVLKFLDDKFEMSICVVLMSTMSLLLFVQVIMRYVVGRSLSWSEELSRYLFIFFVYAGISYGVRMKRHVRVEAFTLWLPERTQAWIRVLSDVLFLFITDISSRREFSVSIRSRPRSN